jgi:effector-binding domain-containing protein
MPYAITLVEESPRLVAATRGRASLTTLPATIPPLFDVVYDYLRSNDVPHRGLNLILYHPLSGSHEFDLEACVEVEARFPGSVAVRCLDTPAGRCASTTHVGSYEGLPAAHAAIRVWCAAHGHLLAGPNWEAYDHWHDDPAERRTDVYYLLT